MVQPLSVLSPLEDVKVNKIDFFFFFLPPWSLLSSGEDL